MALALTACTPQTPAPAYEPPTVTPQGLARVAALPRPYAEADPQIGRTAFAVCTRCHGFSQGADQTKGPILAGVFGGPAAGRTDFAYSEALRRSGFVWDAKRLDQWLFNPHETLPGTSMTFIGVRDDANRRGLVAYLAAVANP